MNRISKTLNNVQTEILTWGDPFSENGQDVIICISGNPGIPDFYIDFASEIHKNLRLPICVIGHAGHGDVLHKELIETVNQDDLFNLQAQVKHKLDLLENHIGQNSRLHLIGHSIGAWMIIELLQKNDNLREKVSTVHLLYPTLQKMAESKNGRFLNNIYRKFYWLILFLGNLLYLLPTFVLQFIIYLYLKVNSMPYDYCDIIIKMINPITLKNVFLMAFEEMDTVRILNTDGINKIKHLTNVIYGTTDDWVPLEHIDDLEIYKPHIQISEAHNTEHAFIIKSSELIAHMVINFIEMKTKT